jgi:RNA polymerase sigma-70 factor (ECF subfamily)
MLSSTDDADERAAAAWRWFASRAGAVHSGHADLFGPSSTAAASGHRRSTSAHYEQREAIELAFSAAASPGNQRAALLLFEVLGSTAAEIATMTATSTTSVNSALARARTRLPARTQQLPPHDPRVQRSRNATQRPCKKATLTEDVTWSMPPLPHWYQGIKAVTDFAIRVP